MVDLTDMRSSQSYLVAVTGITGSGFARDNLLRQFARKRFADRRIDIACTGHAHSLIDVCPSGQRVTDCTTQTGARTAKRLDFRGVVVRFVLELQQPFLHFAVHVHVDENGAGVVFFAHLLIVQQTLFLQVTGTDGRQLHKAERFILATQLHADMAELIQFVLNVGFDERVLHLNIFKDSGEGGVTAVVGPIGVQDAQFCLGRVAVLVSEIIDHASEVVRVHCETKICTCFSIELARKFGKAS